jgi:predicted transcriptional regulator
MDHHPTLSRLTRDLVCAYVARNAVPVAQVPELIRTVHGSLSRLAAGAEAIGTPTSAPAREPASPAVVKKSITNDALISFIDGKPYKTLRRHLTAHGLSPEQYRRRYGLPADYPLVAPSYSKARSDLAKAIGLGVPGALAKAA